MRKTLFFLLATVMMFALVFGAFAGTAYADPPEAYPDPNCWGQASKVFAMAGKMGYHSRNPGENEFPPTQPPDPRVGLRNLAKQLADAELIPDDSMASLGWFVATELKLSIEACDTNGE